jgi:hypothetical protein
MTLYALVRLRRGTAAAFGLCLRSAFIIAMGCSIGSPPCSATSHSIAVSHSGNSHSAFDNLIMLSEIPR